MVEGVSARRAPSDDGAGTEAASDTESDDVVLLNLRHNHLESSPRHRQGVVTARSMYGEELRPFAEELRRRAEGGELLAMAACLAVLVGLTPAVVPEIVLADSEAARSSAFRLDLDAGWACYDLDRVVDTAEVPKSRDYFVPATRWVRVILPDFLIGELVRLRDKQSDARKLEDLIGRPTWQGRRSFVPHSGFRLLWTLARFRRSLGPLLLEHGEARIVTSAALLDFGLSTKSNFSYITFPQRRVDQALAKLHELLAWT